MGPLARRIVCLVALAVTLAGCSAAALTASGGFLNGLSGQPYEPQPQPVYCTSRYYIGTVFTNCY